MDSHLVLAYQQEGASSKYTQSQQQDNIMGRGQCGMVNTAPAPRPSWPGSTARSSVGVASVFNTNNSDEVSSSWEARAFAEDAATCSGQWPPRSYTCSFCQREFRTAQALGGHMNVHRRERAEANELALQQHQQQHTVSSPPLHPLSSAAVQWCIYSPSPIPIATLAKTASSDDEEVGPYFFAAGPAGLTPSILHFSNCKSTVMNKLYMGGAFHPYQSRQVQEPEAVPQEEDHLDLELRLGPSMIFGQ